MFCFIPDIQYLPLFIFNCRDKDSYFLIVNSGLEENIPADGCKIVSVLDQSPASCGEGVDVGSAQDVAYKWACRSSCLVESENRDVMEKQRAANFHVKGVQDTSILNWDLHTV